MKTNLLTVFLMLFLAGCSLPAVTLVDGVDPRFVDDPTKKLGIIKFDTIETISDEHPMTYQFGLLGALISEAIRPAKNNNDIFVDELNVLFQMKSMALLNARMESNPTIRFIDLKWSSYMDPVALSSYLRDFRLGRTKRPSDKEITACIQNNQLDYILYCTAGGRVYDNSPTHQLYVVSNWVIYDREGNKVVSVFTRSVEDKPATELSATDITNRFLELFDQNIDRFFVAIAHPVRPRW